MKYKIRDSWNKRYDYDKYLDQDGIMRDSKSIALFDRDNFDVQWVKEPGDDLVDPKIWEDYKHKKETKEMTNDLIAFLSELRGIITNVQSRLMAIIDPE